MGPQKLLLPTWSDDGIHSTCHKRYENPHPLDSEHRHVDSHICSGICLGLWPNLESYPSEPWLHTGIQCYVQSLLGTLPLLGHLCLCEGLRWTCQWLPILGLVVPHLKDILHDLLVPHVPQLPVLCHAGLQCGLFNVVIDWNLCSSARIRLAAWSHWMPHSRAAIRKNSKAHVTEIARREAVKCYSTSVIINHQFNSKSGIYFCIFLQKLTYLRCII